MSPGNRGVFSVPEKVNLRMSCHSSAASVFSDLVYFLVSSSEVLRLVNGQEY